MFSRFNPNILKVPAALAVTGSIALTGCSSEPPNGPQAPVTDNATLVDFNFSKPPFTPHRDDRVYGVEIGDYSARVARQNGRSVLKIIFKNGASDDPANSDMTTVSGYFKPSKAASALTRIYIPPNFKYPKGDDAESEMKLGLGLGNPKFNSGGEQPKLGKNGEYDGWSARFISRGNGNLYLYAYTGGEKTDDGYGAMRELKENGEPIRLKPGENCLAMNIAINDPGQKNGEITVNVNGKVESFSGFEMTKKGTTSALASKAVLGFFTNGPSPKTQSIFVKKAKVSSLAQSC